MSKNFNNNTIVDSSLNLQVATLNTNLLTNYPNNSTISALLASTVQNQTTLRDTAISNALIPYTTTSTMNALLTNYTNTIALNAILNTNLLNQQTLTNTNIANAITSNNANYLTSTLTNTAISNVSSAQTTYTNTKIATEVVDRNTAIMNNNLSNLSLAKSFTATQSFSDVIIANKLLFSSIGDGSLSYGYTAVGISQCINIGQNSSSNAINSTCLGHNTKAINGFNIAIGCYANANAVNMVSIGYNAGNQSNANNIGCICIGSNSNIGYGATFQNSVAIGINSQITASDQVQLGVSTSTVNCFNITPVNVTATNITGTNITATTNLTTPNLTSSIHNVGQQIISYNSLPLFLSQKYIGFLTSSVTLKTISAFNTYLNLASIAIIPGVFLIQFQINYNYSIGNMLSWWSYGVGTSVSNIDIQACKNFCSSSTILPFPVSNSYMFTSSVSQTIYLNTFISDFDNTNLTIANLSNFSIAGKISICRIA